MSFNRYNVILIGLVATVALSLYLISLNKEPLEGDLTRVGGYSERDFGWRGERTVFAEAQLFDSAQSLEELDQQYDVIILGDSFTRRAHISWASHLADMTGWRILTFHHRDVTVPELLSSEQFKAFPPALFVYQTVERNAIRRLGTLSQLHADWRVTEPVAALQMTPLRAQTRPDQRRREFHGLEERLAVGVHYARVWLKQAFNAAPERVTLPLRDDAPSLFTSEVQDRILITDLDISLRRYSDEQLAKAQTGYHRLHETFESVGVANMVVVFPDKLTVYAPYLQDPSWQNTSVIPRLAAVRPLPRLDLLYAQSVADGLQDIYPPNNTHTSSQGALLAAQHLLAATRAFVQVDEPRDTMTTGE